MRETKTTAPQQSPLFRLIAFFSRLQFSYLYKNVHNPRVLALFFVFLSGSTALGTIALAAYLINLPLLFPPLGPSAFILFHTPMSAAASPKNFILSHSLAVVVGLWSLYLFLILFPEAGLADVTVMNWYRIFAVALATGLTSSVMIVVKCAHPPAAATALIAVMGYLDDPYKIGGIVIAVVLLACEGIFFNRILGGLPYPVWRADPKVVQQYGVLAGIPKGDESYWEQLAKKLYQQR